MTAKGLGAYAMSTLASPVAFEADLIVDDEGLILNYEHLFARVMPA